MDARRMGVWFGARSRPVQAAVAAGVLMILLGLVVLVVRVPAALGGLFLIAGLLGSRKGRKRTSGVFGPLLDAADDQRLAEVERRRALAGPDGFIPLTELADPPTHSQLRSAGSGPGGLEALADAVADFRQAATRPAKAQPASEPPPRDPLPAPAKAPLKAGKTIVEDGRRWRRRRGSSGSIVE